MIFLENFEFYFLTLAFMKALTSDLFKLTQTFTVSIRVVDNAFSVNIARNTVAGILKI